MVEIGGSCSRWTGRTEPRAWGGPGDRDLLTVADPVGGDATLGLRRLDGDGHHELVLAGATYVALEPGVRKIVSID